MKSVFSRIIFLSFVLCFFLSPSISFAAQATLTWDPPVVSTDVTGYIIHYGTAPGTYTQGIDVGKTTSYTVSNLNDGQTYYFAATAYNKTGKQSIYSNEVSKGTPIQQYSSCDQQTWQWSGHRIRDRDKLRRYMPCFLQPSHRGVSLRKSGFRINLFRLVGGRMQRNRAVRGHNKRGDHHHGYIQHKYSTTYSITATVNGSGGAISPSGTSSVSSGGSKTFTITPNTGYQIANVIVDGKSVGVVTNYTFSNVTANHTISATFTANIMTYAITASVSGTGGTISPSGTSSVSSRGE